MRMCGLVKRNSEEAVPLKTSLVDATIVSDFFCKVRVQQHFKNENVRGEGQASSVDVRYIFMLDEEAAVCSFKAVLGSGVTIDGIVKEKEEAKREFDNAIKDGRKAALMQQEDATNLFSCEIGNLEPDEMCIVFIEYVTELKVYGNQIRFSLPQRLVPDVPEAPALRWMCRRYRPRGRNLRRLPNGVYAPDHSSILKSKGKWGTTKPGVPVRRTCGRRIPVGGIPFGYHEWFLQNPPNQPLGSPIPEARKQAVISRVTVDVSMSSAIKSIKSQTHEIVVHKDDNDANKNRAQVVFQDRIADAEGIRPSPGSKTNGDFVLHLEQEKPFQTRSVIETSDDGRTQAVQVTFCKEPSKGVDVVKLQCELMFLVDTSGSMSGYRQAESPLQQVKNTLQVFLRSLPTSCKFNIISFASIHTKMFKESLDYGQNALELATKWTGGLRAVGGTNLLDPLDALLSEERLPGYPRQIFVLTDGQVRDRQAVVDRVRRDRSTTRVFSFGIGNGVDRQLCNGIAEAGGGNAEFVSEGDSIGEKVMRTLKRALHEPYTDVNVDWSEFGADCPELKPISPPPRAAAAVKPGRDSWWIRRRKEAPASKPSEAPVVSKAAKAAPVGQAPDGSARWLVQFPQEMPPVYPEDRYFVYCIKHLGNPKAAIENSFEGTFEIEENFGAEGEDVEGEDVEGEDAEGGGVEGAEGGVLEGRSEEGLDQTQHTGGDETEEDIEDFSIRITAKKGGRDDLDLEVPVSAEGAERGCIIHCLAARARIKELERGAQTKEVKELIIALGTRFNLSSKFTSFVAVQRTDAEHDQLEHDRKKSDASSKPREWAMVLEKAPLLRNEPNRRRAQSRSAYRMSAAPMSAPRGGAMFASSHMASMSPPRGPLDGIRCGGGGPGQVFHSAPRASRPVLGSVRPSSRGGSLKKSGVSSVAKPRALHSFQPSSASLHQLDDLIHMHRAKIADGGADDSDDDEWEDDDTCDNFAGTSPSPSQTEKERLDNLEEFFKKKMEMKKQRRIPKEAKGKGRPKSAAKQIAEERQYEYIAKSMEKKAKKRKQPQAKEAEGKGRPKSAAVGGGGRGSSSASPSPSPLHTVLGFYELVGLQQFDGRWVVSNELKNGVGDAAYAKLTQLDVFVGLSEDFVATCIALRLLAVRFASRESEWALMASKARVFLEAELEKAGKKAADLDGMLAKVEV